MGAAFDEACAFVREKQPPVVREVIADRIVEAAARGERHPAVLKNIALAAIGRI